MMQVTNWAELKLKQVQVPGFTDWLARLLWSVSFRGKSRLLNSIGPKQGEVRCQRFGCSVDCDLGDFIQRQMFLGTYEPAESTVVRRTLKSGMTFCDVGENVGWFTLMAARLVGETGRVISFEPGPYAFRRLETTVLRNSLTQVRLVNAGLSESEGFLDLYEPGAYGNYTPTMVANGGGRPITVPIITLDKWLEGSGIEAIDLLKIDVEGHEPKALLGARKWLASGRIKGVLCEFNGPWLREAGSSPKELEDLLTSNGFSAIAPNKSTKAPYGELSTRLFLHHPSAASRK